MHRARLLLQVTLCSVQLLCSPMADNSPCSCLPVLGPFIPGYSAVVQGAKVGGWGVRWALLGLLPVCTLQLIPCINLALLYFVFIFLPLFRISARAAGL